MFLFGFPKNTTFSNPSNNFDIVNSSVDIITYNIHPCKYHNSFIYPQNKLHTTKIFSFIHFNIRSLQKNFDSLHKFLGQHNKSLEKLKNNHTVYLIGNFNINLASTDDTNSLSNSATAYIDMLRSNGYFPIISLPTHVNDHSACIIDHIVSNDHLLSVSPGIIKCNLTDHYPIFCIVSNLLVKKAIQPIYQRNFSKFNQNDFCEHLHNEFFSLFQDKKEINAENFDVIFSRFLCIINRAINIFASLERLSRS